jgi:uncharacterized phage protein gp47/JayE
MMADLIPTPVLDDRDEEKIAAEMIARISGGLTLETIDSGIEVWRRLREMVVAGLLPVPACPELTNANPPSPHTVPLEAMAWLAGLQSYKLNQVPALVYIAFHQLFGIQMRQATPATTTLQFTSSAPAGVDVTIPAGTEVGTDGGDITFLTDADLLIAAGHLTGTVSATRTGAGATSLAQGTLTRLIDSIAFVSAVTNPAAVESGSDAETVASALARARNYQRRAERLVSAQDLKDAILEDVLFGNGIVKAFPVVKDGDWLNVSVGHTTVVVMTKTGGAVDDAKKKAINSLLYQAIGAPFIYVKDPTYVEFDVQADVRVSAFTSQVAVRSAAEAKLRSFYAPSEGNIGRSILRSEIIAVIEGTQGVSRIEPQPGGAILAAPLADVDLATYVLPKLVNVTINVVQ